MAITTKKPVSTTKKTTATPKTTASTAVQKAYGPATGNYSPRSIQAARKTGGVSGDKLVRNSTGGFDYVKDKTGVQKDPHSFYSSPTGNAYSEYARSYNDLLQEQIDAQLKAQRLATERGVANLQNQKVTIGKGYDEQARQGEIAYRQRQQLLPEQLAAQGITGGGTETANLTSQLGLESGRRTIDTERQNAYNNIDQSIADLYSTGDVNAANIQADAVGKRLDEFQRQQAYAREDAQTAKAQTREDALASRGGAYMNIQAKINELKNDGDTANDWLIPYYESDRATKQLTEEQTAYDRYVAAEKQNYQRELDQQKLDISRQKNAISAAKKSSSGGSGSSGGITNKTDAFNSEYADVVAGGISKADVKANQDALIRTYGATSYKELYDAAAKYYKGSGDSGKQYLTAF